MVCAIIDPWVTTIIVSINIICCFLYFIPFRFQCYNVVIRDIIERNSFMLFSLILAMFTAAVLSTAAPDAWPKGPSSQFTIVLSFFIFYCFVFDVLWVFLIPLCTLGLLDPIWTLMINFIKCTWKNTFGIEVTNLTCILTLIFLLLLIGGIVYYINKMRWIHHWMYTLLYCFSITSTLKTIHYNIPSQLICCSVSLDDSPDLCPLYLNHYYVIILIFTMIICIPLSIYNTNMSDFLCCCCIHHKKINRTRTKDNQLYTSINTL